MATHDNISNYEYQNLVTSSGRKSVKDMIQQMKNPV